MRAMLVCIVFALLGDLGFELALLAGIGFGGTGMVARGEDLRGRPAVA